jgi:two-component system sensor histidine kinase YesM
LLKISINSLHKTIFVRLVFIYLIVILPNILLGIYLYNWSYKNASQEISSNTLVQLTTYLEDLNREIEWMEIQQFDILQENELRRIALTWELMDNVQRRTSMNYMLHRLTSIKNTSAYIKDIFVHIHSIDKTISDGNAVQDFDHARYDKIRLSVQGAERRLIKHQDSLNLSVSTMGKNKGEEPLFVVQIELDTEKLKRSLGNINMYPQSATFVISDELGVLFAAGEELQKYLEVDDSKDSKNLINVDGKLYHIDKAESDKLGLSVVTYLPEEMVKRTLSKFSIWAWLFLVTSIIGILIYSFSTFRLVHRPLLLLVHAFERMEGGSLDTRIEHEKSDEFGFLYDRYNKMLIKLQTLIDQGYKQKLMMQKAELKQLQSQINPHFLYNSFFILNSLAKLEDTERIEVFTKMLGEYFRFITRNGEDNVLLSEEVKHARMYTEIQKLRFSRRISVQFDELPKGMEHILVPRLIIQPIIENAYEHSLENMSDEGLIRVIFVVHDNEVRIIVEDNGDTISDVEIDELNYSLTRMDELQELTGMVNIHRRIVLTYGEGSGLVLSRSELNGLQVMIRIELRE